MRTFYDNYDEIYKFDLSFNFMNYEARIMNFNLNPNKQINVNK